MSKKTRTESQMTRRQLARREREQRTQQILIYAAIAVGAVIVFILAYGAITEITQARRPVARVGDRIITSNEFKARQSYERWMTELEIFQYQNYLTEIDSQQLGGDDPALEGPTFPSETTDSDDALAQQLQLAISQLEQELSSDFANVYAGQVLDSMIEEELVRQAADTYDLTVSEDEMQRQIELTLGYDREAAGATLTETATLTDTAAAAALAQPDFEELYEQFDVNVLKVTRYPEEAFRESVRAQVLRTKLQEVLAEDVDAVQDQVEVALFVVETMEEGEALQAQINEEGEDPEALVEAYMNDESTTTTAYELPWLPLSSWVGQFSDEVQRAAFNTPVGRASQPVKDRDESIYVIYVKGHEERELSPELLDQAGQQQYQTWLTEQQNEKAEYLEWQEAVIEE
jgi:hypothetical protein